ncbi:hypothetical protein BTN49_2625 [Candidatus Enterovibrio escicola]|uniref:Uncharacterized protein n=1 Tax=Candidatus Enterovibrio escicola TaxID=1927127 RepID=A0A2A5T0W9_9GAMM|nr:hypothetical protein BTN49_2625 [Candidatus Enterovibrio escacola]
MIQTLSSPMSTVSVKLSFLFLGEHLEEQMNHVFNGFIII